ncbi:hypothetical protein D3C81_842590 [compost metagenome]
MTLRERVALLLYHQPSPFATAEDVSTLQRVDAVVPAEILAAAGDLLEEYGMITHRFGDDGFVRRSQALRRLLQSLDEGNFDAAL